MGHKKSEIIKILNNFKDARIAVIGDLMLDHYIFGKTERVSPEAPVPIVLVEKEKFIPGGAGNVACNISSLGATVFIFGVTGKDTAGEQLVCELEKRGVTSRFISRLSDRRTTQKIRIVSQNQQVLRVDKEDKKFLDAKIEEKIISEFSNIVKHCDAVIISNYSKGVVSRNLSENVIRFSRKANKPIVGDIGSTSPKDALYFKNVTLFKPNYKTAVGISGMIDLMKAGEYIQRKLKCNVLITQGPDGMTLFKGNKATHFSAQGREVFDVSGAGDTVVAVISLSLAVGAKLRDSVYLSNLAAGIATGKVGTACVSLSELRKMLTIKML